MRFCIPTHPRGLYNISKYFEEGTRVSSANIMYNVSLAWCGRLAKVTQSKTRARDHGIIFL